MPIDPSVLLQAQGIRLPDPVQYATQAMTLADLAGRRDLQKMTLDAARRKEEQERAIGGALGGLDVTNDQAVAAAMQQLPDYARPGFAKYVMDQRKERADLGKTEAETNAKRADVKQKAMRDIANVAAEEAKRPDNLSLSRVKKMADFYGVELPQMPTDPRDVNGVGAYLTMLGNAGYDVKDREAAANTRRGQDLTRQSAVEGHGVTMRGQDMTAQTAAAGQAVTRRGQDLTNARALETNALTREANANAKVNAETQALAKFADSNALPNLVTSANALNQSLKDYAGKDIPGVGPIDSHVPTLLQSDEGKRIRSQIQAVSNDLLKLYSGGAVTLNEAERRAVEMMANGSFSDDDLRTAWPLVLGRINAASANARAGFSPQAVETYEQRGGTALRQIEPAPGPQKKAEAPSKPRLGEVRRGYLYKGGDPSSPSSWEKVKG